MTAYDVAHKCRLCSADCVFSGIDSLFWWPYGLRQAVAVIRQAFAMDPVHYQALLDAACDLPSLKKASKELSEAIQVIPILKRKVEELEGTIKNLEQVYKKGYQRLAGRCADLQLFCNEHIEQHEAKDKALYAKLAECAAAKAAAEGEGEVDINNKVASGL